ncbi:hypothetical protein BC830DRAFT_1152872 [Chytriomyces sp. MP71]|nr:hypothetical protein BC830DRAFT_1152872 [Chytriomyces sp. MP71]
MCPHGHHLGADDEGEFVAKNQLKSPTMWLHAFQSDQQRDVRTKPHQLHSSLQTCQETTSKAFIASNYVQLSEPTHFFASVDPKNASIEWSPPISASTATILKYTNKHLKRRSSDLSEKIASLTLSPPSDVSSSYSATSTKTESADQMCPPAPPPSPSTGRCIFNSSSPVRAGVDAKAVGAASTTTSFKSETDGFNTTPRARPHGHGLAQKNINKTKKRYKIGHAEYESIAAAVEYIMCQEGDAAAGNEDTFRKGRFTVTPILR